MSSRYYEQMCEFLRISPSELDNYLKHEPEKLQSKIDRKLNRGTKTVASKKRTRRDISNYISERIGADLTIEKLPLPTLEAVEDCAKVKGKFTKVEVPTGRLKQPYIDALKTMFGKELEFSSITVKSMTELLEAFNNL